MRSYQRFLLLLGAVFVPLLGVLLADWLLAGAPLHATSTSSTARRFGRDRSPRGWSASLVYEWLYQPTDLGFWSTLLGSPADALVPDRRLAAELRGRLRADGARRGARLGACRRSPSSGTSRATWLTAARRASGAAPYYAARAPARARRARDDLHALRDRDDREQFIRSLTALGLPVVSLEGTETTSFSFHYEGSVAHHDRRASRERLVTPRRRRGDPARQLDARRAAPPLGLPGRDARSARQRPTALVRRRKGSSACGTRPAHTRRGLRPRAARARPDSQAGGRGGRGDRRRRTRSASRRSLVTSGSAARGVYYKGTLRAGGRLARRHGSDRHRGDAFSAAYLAGARAGIAPVSAARHATGVVAALLTGRVSVTAAVRAASRACCSSTWRPRQVLGLMPSDFEPMR